MTNTDLSRLARPAAPSGHVVGIDIAVALGLAAARGCDLVVLSELLPAAEAGLVDAFSAGDGVSLIDRRYDVP